MNKLEPILRFLSDENFEFIIDAEADLCVSDPLNRYAEEPSNTGYLHLLNVDELHEKGLQKSLMNLGTFDDVFIDSLMYSTGAYKDERN